MKLLTHYLTAQKAPRRGPVNWRGNHLNDHLFYSYRDTEYDPGSYPSLLHYHDYYELVIFEEGEICYICEGDTLRPRRGDIILIPPHRLHMSAIDAAHTRYRRHVFYLYPEAFEAMGCGSLAEFLPRDPAYLQIEPARQQALFGLLKQLDEALKSPAAPEQALGLGLTIQVFYLLNCKTMPAAAGEPALPRAVAEIQQYLDGHFTEIRSVSEVAARFFYSREYVSRLFQRWFHTTLSEYLTTRRVAYSQTLIERGTPLSETCFAAGFGNMTSFIRAFRAVTGMTPSAYRALANQQKI